MMLQNVEYAQAGSLDGTGDADLGIPSDSGVEKISLVPVTGTAPYWLDDCLADAKNVITEYHDEKPDDRNFEDCAKFFGNKTFDVRIQNNGNASGDINVIKDLPSQPSYRICVHDVFQEDTRANRRMVTVVLIHQLLHAIHPSRMHDMPPGIRGINKLERELANKANYHDALLNLESLHHGGRVSACGV